MGSEKAALGAGIFSVLAEAALQVSGYQNLPLAVVLGCGAVVGLGYAAFHYVRGWLLKPARDERSAQRLKRWRRKLSGFINALPVIGVLVGGFIFVASIAWILSDSRKANADLAKTMARYVLPRHLTDDQITAISKYLSGFPSQAVKFLVMKNSEEASSYRADFQRAIEQGGWRVTAVDYTDDIPEGITTQIIQTMVSMQAPRDPRAPRVDELFAQALRQAHVPLSAQQSGGGIAVTENSFQIRIGRRRMDDGDLKYREQQRERAKRILEDTDS